jgi:ABC-type multidrug transport system fused ATPase/permease subunit
VLFNGPTFHVSGVQIVADPGEVSLYFTATRHAFSQTGTQVRSVNEIATRLTMSLSAFERMTEILRISVEQQKRTASSLSA